MDKSLPKPNDWFVAEGGGEDGFHIEQSAPEPDGDPQDESGSIEQPFFERMLEHG